MAKDEEEVEGGQDDRDVLIETIGSFPSSKSGETITVSLRSWDKGPVKIRTGRSGSRKKGPDYINKLGQITATEARLLCPLLLQAADKLDKLAQTKAK